MFFYVGSKTLKILKTSKALIILLLSTILFSISSSLFAYSDYEIKSHFRKAHLDLEDIWEAYFYSNLRAKEESQILNASRMENLPLELQEKIKKNLSRIYEVIKKDKRVLETFKKSALPYFTFSSISHRMGYDDQSILDLPLLASEIKSDNQVLTYESLSQEDPEFREKAGDLHEDAIENQISMEKESGPKDILKRMLTYGLLASAEFALPLARYVAFNEPLIKPIPIPKPAFVPNEFKLNQGTKASEPRFSCSGSVCSIEREEAISEDSRLDVCPVPSFFEISLASVVKPFDHGHSLWAGQKNQGPHGTCWSFASSRLAENQICLNNPKSEFCQKEISPFSIRPFTYGSSNEGYVTVDAVSNIIQSGVCLGQYAPYPTQEDEGLIIQNLLQYDEKIMDSSRCLLPPSLEERTIVNSKSGHTYVIDSKLYEAIKLSHEEIGFDTCLPSMDPMQRSGNNIYEDLANHVKDPYLVSQGLENTFYTKDCQNNLIKEPFQDLSVMVNEYPIPNEDQHSQEEVIHMAKDLSELASEGHIIGLSVCSHKLTSKTPTPKCGNHAIVIDAVTCKKDSQDPETCMAHIVNSWGNSPRLGGYIPLSTLMKYSYRFYTFTSAPLPAPSPSKI